MPLLNTVLGQQDDRDLVRRLRNRDQAALGVLYDRYGRMVFSLILRVVRDRGTAEDLTQETFLRIWNRAASFDLDRGALGPWVLTVARNRAIDYLRSLEGRMSAGAVDLDRAERPENFSGMDEALVSVDQVRRLQGAFRKLTPNQRNVIELAYYEGLSHSEMAARMQQPLGTVKTWVRGALKVLRDEMGQEMTA
jgi:RNA polymerase sigma-70 factor (ECF subfamily)